MMVLLFIGECLDEVKSCWFYIRSARGGLHLVADGHIFYEDGGSHPRRVTWRCARSYQKAERCQVALCLRDGRLVYFRGSHNHPATYNPAKHESRRFQVDPMGNQRKIGDGGFLGSIPLAVTIVSGCSPERPSSVGGPLLRMGAHWYRLDACYLRKRRWLCARGCGARIHTAGKHLVFTELRHRCRTTDIVNHTSLQVALIGHRVALVQSDEITHHFLLLYSLFLVEVLYSSKGYPKLAMNGYYYRPHNAYRNQSKVLWYCSGRSKYQCTAKLRTFNREVVAIGGTHNHER
ncbi:FLYWCH zinc finger domain-containing protein [Phthorimaea operculella]|nr:FLYWCH zinc finger domain-containing protein [Phthorimaea operculella]